jgi:N-acetyl-anhydromuramyl-L-alanine amidase AmpD
MKIVEKLTGNFAPGRGGLKPKAFVIHVSEGSFEGTLNRCLDKISQISYHYLVRADGEIYKLVDPKNTAWHAGLVVKPTWQGLTVGQNPNLTTIGIAFAGWTIKGPTLAQILAMRELIVSLAVIHNIPIDKKTIIGHNEIRTDKLCPGPKMSVEMLGRLCLLS